MHVKKAGKKVKKKTKNKQKKNRWDKQKTSSKTVDLYLTNQIAYYEECKHL